MSNLVWLRADLRVHDNPALYAAIENARSSSRSGEQRDCIAVYALCEQQWDVHDLAPAKRSLIIRQLRLLEAELNQLNVPLIVINSGRFESVAGGLLEVSRRFQAKAIYFNYEYELNERILSRQVREELEEQAIAVHGFHDQCVIPPGEILNGSGEMYQVYTSFKNRYLARFEQAARPILGKPSMLEKNAFCSDLSALKEANVDHELEAVWPAGEAEAHDRLAGFLEERVMAYRAERDFPVLNATSTLSPYLAIGALSTGLCFNAVISLNQGSLHSENEGITTWVNELVWREFYRHFIYAFPHVCKHQAFKQETENVPWRDDEQLFSAWCEGTTGYPIVDAGMRQLNRTGWMHNRLRMICAMFLSKHLLIDWRVGERYFMKHLVDGDFASNNGGWQWSASTGVDAAPYFRIFNPTRQSERFDPKGEFIRQYVPELSSLEGSAIHNPDSEQRQAAGYPEPIVDHKSSVERTKRLFSECTRQVSDCTRQVSECAQQVQGENVDTEKTDHSTTLDCQPSVKRAS